MQSRKPHTGLPTPGKCTVTVTLTQAGPKSGRFRWHVKRDVNLSQDHLDGILTVVRDRCPQRTRVEFPDTLRRAQQRSAHREDPLANTPCEIGAASVGRITPDCNLANFLQRYPRPDTVKRLSSSVHLSECQSRRRPFRSHATYHLACHGP